MTPIYAPGVVAWALLGVAGAGDQEVVGLVVDPNNPTKIAFADRVAPGGKPFIGYRF
jgi:hypothetical protein